MQAAVAGPSLGIDFLRKFKVTVAPEISQIQFICTAVASSCLPSSSLVPVVPPAQTNSSQPPAISAQLAWKSQGEVAQL
jgi:hypothetical protein